MEENESKVDKSSDAITIEQTKWKLKILEGKSIERVENQERELYFMLDNKENRVTGFSGCNTFTGSYTIEDGGRIRFAQMASTMKSCPDVAIDESEFLKVFELADNYSNHGNELSLNVGRRTPLAIFEAVDMK